MKILKLIIYFLYDFRDIKKYSSIELILEKYIIIIIVLKFIFFDFILQYWIDLELSFIIYFVLIFIRLS